VADIAPLKKQLAEDRLKTGKSISITSYIAKCFACAIENDKRMQSRRLGKSRLIVFDDVDLAFTMEREWEGETITVFYIVRAAHQKTVSEIHRELQAAKATPLGLDGPMNALEMQFFLLPRVIRKALWFVIRRIPYVFKDLIGTAVVTSMGMFTEGAAVVFPIAPCLMLSIGSIEKRLALQDGEVVERDFIHLNISVDHAIIDGAPLMRFGEQFKKILASGVISTPAIAA
jgi:pyruvate/2-oxoglutarate dehydrogenase complex dihydrolipoamide acyltransferase (E2) component